MDMARRSFNQFGLLGFSQGSVTTANAAGRLRDLCSVVLECILPAPALMLASSCLRP